MPSLKELDRLVCALEALTLEQQTLLHQRQFEDVVSLQAREMPLVERITELVLDDRVRARIDSHLRARIHHILSRLGDNSTFLDQAMQETRVALAELGRSSVRARAVRPAYGRTSHPPWAQAFSAEG